jgi:hypothetical protein
MRSNAVRCPQANAFCERLIGTVRRECLDWLIALSERHLRSVLQEGVAHYNHGHTPASVRAYPTCRSTGSRDRTALRFLMATESSPPRSLRVAPQMPLRTIGGVNPKKGGVRLTQLLRSTAVGCGSRPVPCSFDVTEAIRRLHPIDARLTRFTPRNPRTSSDNSPRHYRRRSAITNVTSSSKPRPVRCVSSPNAVSANCSADVCSMSDSQRATRSPSKN